MEKVVSKCECRKLFQLGLNYHNPKPLVSHFTMLLIKMQLDFPDFLLVRVNQFAFRSKLHSCGNEIKNSSSLATLHICIKVEIMTCLEKSDYGRIPLGKPECSSDHATF